MTFYQLSPRESLEDPSGVEQLDPSSPPSTGSPPVLYYSDAFGNLFATIPTIPGPTGDYPSLNLNQPQPQCLMPLLNPKVSPLESHGGYAADMWTSMDAYSYDAVSPASASPTTFEHGSQVLSPSLNNAHLPPQAIPAGRQPSSVGYTDARVSFSPRIVGNPGDDSRGPQEHPSLPRPLNDQRQHQHHDHDHDHTPPYMTPQAIKARELILKCDFPKDRSPQPAVAGPDTSNIAMGNDTHTSGRN
ncbi:hypothetical protein E4U13_007862 [Claviceps humidiphila]|uniref:Uncharacterized protein n=1 Tax=Claviceps humidiphila TaxID=1294629 RepID=A0A9P7Q5D5_9HYPO|nr:hypothetical protein E4U13_007862 [Claviceps humidiphila]